MFFFQKKMFCAFWALDIAPTLDVPVLFLLILPKPLYLHSIYALSYVNYGGSVRL